MHENRSDALLMAAMMAMCASVFLLVVLVPALGFAPGLVSPALLAGAMIYVHLKLMGAGHGH